MVLIGIISLRPSPDRSTSAMLVPEPPALREIVRTPRTCDSSDLGGHGVIVAASATILAYPIAYFLTFRAGRRATLFLICCSSRRGELPAAGHGLAAHARTARDADSLLEWAGVISERSTSHLLARGS